MLARRLLAAAGSGSTFTPPATGDSSFTLTNAPHGGWSEPQRPKAIYYNGKTYIGWVSGTTGDVEIAAYDHATQIMGTPFVLHAALGGEGTADLHDNPSILVRDSDKRLVVAYCAHADSTVRLRISTNPEDVSAFDGEVSLDASLGGAIYDYPVLFQLTGEANDPIYLFYRDTVSGTSELTYSKSTNGGVTWGSGVTLYKNLGFEPYWQINSNGVDRIDVATIDKNPDEAANTTLYHFYMSGGNRYKTDGTQITVATPMAPGDLQVADPSTDGAHQLYDLVYDGTNPVIGCAVWWTRYTHYSGRRVIWNGSAWSASDAVDVPSGIPATALVGMAVDPLDTDIVYVTRYVSSKWVIEKHTWNGSSWSSVQASPDDGDWHLYPISVVNAQPELRILWMSGSYVSYLDWDTGVTGYGS